MRFTNAQGLTDNSPFEIQVSVSIGAVVSPASTATLTAAESLFFGLVTNDSDPNQSGSGIWGAWSYQGMMGTQAGDAMCTDIGADHVCTYAEILEADNAGDLVNIPDGTSIWINRVNLSVEIEEGMISGPGAGGRCNDWTTNTNHENDGEYATFMNGAASYFLDKNTSVGPSHADPTGLPCGPELRAIACCLAEE